MSPEDIALLKAGQPIGILLPTDDTMRLVPVTRGVVEVYVGTSAESVTTTDGPVFWFHGSTDVPINVLATLNLLAVSDFSPRTVPLLRGAVLITGQFAGQPDGLTHPQTKALLQESGPRWWKNWMLHMRVEGDAQRRRSRH
ncbi:hypothetical protein [Mycolicibacterium conceptionense]|uniref:hypothetical protein n=1 Tax=Mycolicibacterium conceptionense TaxID=451644 RepID=UPI000AFDE589|nr:hypothetical protein [Mycolicibacterium conceptionense]